MDSKFDSFEDIKSKAYIAAEEGKETNYDKLWKQKYSDNNFVGYSGWIFQKILFLYRGYTTGKRSKEEVDIELKKLEEEFFKTQIKFKNRKIFKTEAINAFKNKEIEALEAKFKCPFCGGTVLAKKHISENDGIIPIEISFCGKCEKCGYNEM